MMNESIDKKIALFVMPNFYKHAKRMGGDRIEIFFNSDLFFSKVIIISIGDNSSRKQFGTLTVIELKTNNYRPRISYWFYKMFGYKCNFYKKVISIAREFKVDILIQRYGGIIVHGVPIVIAAKKLNLPSVVTVQNAYDESRFYSSHGFKRFARTIVEEPIERFVLANTNKIWIVSKYLSKYVSKYGDFNNKTTAIYNKTDERILYSIPKSSDKKVVDKIFSNIIFSDNVFLSVGRLIPQKNYEIMIKAFEYYLKLGNEGTYLIVGQGPELVKHQDYIKKNGLCKNIIIITDYLNIIQLGLLLKKSNALLFCSLFEGQGRVVYESLAFGTPVIGSDLGPIPEMLRHKSNGFLVNPFSIKDITRGLLEFTIEKKKYNSEFCQNSAKRFFIDHINKKEVTFYSEIFN